MADLLRPIAVQFSDGDNNITNITGCSLRTKYDAALLLVDITADNHLSQAKVQSRTDPMTTAVAISLVKLLRNSPEDVFGVDPPKLLVHQVQFVDENEPPTPSSTMISQARSDIGKVAVEPTISQANLLLEIVTTETSPVFPNTLDTQNICHVVAWSLHLLSQMSLADRLQFLHDAYKARMEGREHEYIRSTNYELGQSQFSEWPDHHLLIGGAKVLQGMVNLRLSSITGGRRLEIWHLLGRDLLMAHAGVVAEKTDADLEGIVLRDEDDLPDLTGTLTLDDIGFAKHNLSTYESDIALVTPTTFSGNGNFLSQHHLADCVFYSYRAQENMNNASPLNIGEKIRSVSVYMGTHNDEVQPWQVRQYKAVQGIRPRFKRVVELLVPREFHAAFWGRAKNTYVGHRGKFHGLVSIMTREKIMSMEPNARVPYIEKMVPSCLREHTYKALVTAAGAGNDWKTVKAKVPKKPKRDDPHLYYVAAYFSYLLSYFPEGSEALHQKWLAMNDGGKESDSGRRYVYYLIECLYFPSRAFITSFEEIECDNVKKSGSKTIVEYDDHGRTPEEDFAERNRRCVWRKALREVNLIGHYCSIHLALPGPTAEVGPTGHTVVSITDLLVGAMLDGRLGVSRRVRGGFTRNGAHDRYYPGQPLSCFDPWFVASTKNGAVPLSVVFEFLKRGDELWRGIVLDQRPLLDDAANENEMGNQTKEQEQNSGATVDSATTNIAAPDEQLDRRSLLDDAANENEIGNQTKQQEQNPVATVDSATANNAAPDEQLGLPQETPASPGTPTSLGGINSTCSTSAIATTVPPTPSTTATQEQLPKSVRKPWLSTVFDIWKGVEVPASEHLNYHIVSPPKKEDGSFTTADHSSDGSGQEDAPSVSSENSSAKEDDVGGSSTGGEPTTQLNDGSSTGGEPTTQLNHDMGAYRDVNGANAEDESMGSDVEEQESAHNDTALLGMHNIPKPFNFPASTFTYSQEEKEKQPADESSATETNQPTAPGEHKEEEDAANHKDEQAATADGGEEDDFPEPNTQPGDTASDDDNKEGGPAGEDKDKEDAAEERDQRGASGSPGDNESGTSAAEKKNDNNEPSGEADAGGAPANNVTLREEGDGAGDNNGSDTSSAAENNTDAPPPDPSTVKPRAPRPPPLPITQNKGEEIGGRRYPTRPGSHSEVNEQDQPDEPGGSNNKKMKNSRPDEVTRWLEVQRLVSKPKHPIVQSHYQIFQEIVATQTCWKNMVEAVGEHVAELKEQRDGATDLEPERTQEASSRASRKRAADDSDGVPSPESKRGRR